MTPPDEPLVRLESEQHPGGWCERAPGRAPCPNPSRYRVLLGRLQLHICESCLIDSMIDGVPPRTRA